MVPPRKITAYHVSDSHPEGRAKARFFRSLGFRSDRPDELADALRELARSMDVTESTFGFGTKYVGSGRLTCPAGGSAEVVVVWVLLEDAPPPRFVTAYPT
jgi:hypothetical protein